MRKKYVPVITVCILIIILAFTGAITLSIKRYMPTRKSIDGKEYFHLEKESEAALIVNHNKVEEKLLVLDGRYYVEDKVVGKYINSRFYWDEKKKVLIYTLPLETFMIVPDTKEYQTSEGTRSLDYVILRSYEGSYYLDLEFIRQFTDMECEIYQEPERVVIKNDWSEVKKVTVKKDGKIRLKGGIKSPILCEVKKEDNLILQEQMENWSKVSTKNGYTGYIENKKLSKAVPYTEEHEGKEMEYTSLVRNHKIGLVWHQMTSMDGNNTLASMMEGVTGINTISPTWFSVTDTIGTISSLASKEYVDQAHAMGLEVWGLVDNFSPSTDTLAVLSDTMVRKHMIDQLISEALRVGMDGINLDFESITEEQGPHYVQFIRELSVACRKNGLVFSIDNPVPMSYNSYYDRKEQGIVADYVIIMGYDEHHVNSKEAGSVASLEFVKNGIEETLKDVPKEKVINGIPFYTRLWKEPFGGGHLTSEVFGMERAASYVTEHGMETFWDDQTGQNVGYLEGEDGIYTMWLEDEQSIGEKMKLIQQYELAGTACWKLGFQKNSVWPVIAQYLK